MKSFLPTLLLSCIILCSCSEKDTTKPVVVIPSYNVTGHIVSVTNTPLQQVEVKFFKNGNTLTPATGKTNADGVFTITLEAGMYSTAVSVTGYKQYTDTIQVAEKTGDINVILSGNASVSGRIINSQTAKGLANARISFERDHSGGRISSNDVEGIEFVAMADDSGRYELAELPTGNFIASVEKEGFFVRENVPVVLENETELPNVVSVAKALPGELRVVLTWNKYPSDLDLNLRGPDGAGGIFEVWWMFKNSVSTASLDVDVTTGYGPETTTIHSFIPGTYKFNVIDYDSGFFTWEGSEKIHKSPAKIEVYDENGLIETLVAAPTQGVTGNAWQAFEIMATEDDYTINVINKYTSLFGGTLDPLPPQYYYSGRMAKKKY